MVFGRVRVIRLILLCPLATPLHAFGRSGQTVSKLHNKRHSFLDGAAPYGNGTRSYRNFILKCLLALLSSKERSRQKAICLCWLDYPAPASLGFPRPCLPTIRRDGLTFLKMTQEAEPCARLKSVTPKVALSWTDVILLIQTENSGLIWHQFGQ
jgi:hypothetical protein